MAPTDDSSPAEDAPPDIAPGARRPATRRGTRRAWIARLCCGLLCLGGLGLIASLGARDVGQLRALHERGVRAEGTVILHHSSFNRRTEYFLDYLFPADTADDAKEVPRKVPRPEHARAGGDPLDIAVADLPGDLAVHTDMVSGTEEVSVAEYVRARDGDRLTVTYLPGDPGVHRVGVVDARAVRRARVRWWLEGAAAVVALGLIVLATELGLGGSPGLGGNPARAASVGK